MTRVLFAWEMGNNYGHLGTIAPLLPILKAEGATLFLALQNPQAITHIPIDFDIQVLPAPFIKPNGRQNQNIPVLNYADDILPCGYNAADSLVTLLRCWYALYDLIMPDVVVTESAPTAQLAARRSHIPVFALGNGYNLPPQTSPMPGFLKDPAPSQEELIRREKRTLDTINQALDILHQPQLTCFSDLLQTDGYALATYPELDHYGPRNHVNYIGPMISSGKLPAPIWPTTEQTPKIFAYLRPGHPLFVPMLNVLKQTSCTALIIAPGCPEQIRSSFSNIPHLHIQTTPVSLTEALAQSDLVISHASHGTSSEALLQGKPLLMLPGHLEQLMLAQRIVAQKLGLFVHINGTIPQLQMALHRVLNDADIRANALSFQKRYANKTEKTSLRNLARTILTCAETHI